VLEEMFGGTLPKAFGVLAVLAVLLLTTACDGIIDLRGRVYEQRRPGARSRAFIDRTPDDDLSGLTPLASAKVTLYHGEDYDKTNIDPSTGFKSETVTGDSGEFDAGGVTAPYKFNAALLVEKPGYKSVTQIFPHDELGHTAVVILVPETQP
jgi:hypothetical protein